VELLMRLIWWPCKASVAGCNILSVCTWLLPVVVYTIPIGNFYFTRPLDAQTLKLSSLHSNRRAFVFFPRLVLHLWSPS
jgi:hypothetical protein